MFLQSLGWRNLSYFRKKVGISSTHPAVVPFEATAELHLRPSDRVADPAKHSTASSVPPHPSCWCDCRSPDTELSKAYKDYSR